MSGRFGGRRAAGAVGAAAVAALLTGVAAACGGEDSGRAERVAGVRPLSPAERAAAIPVRVRVFEYGFEPTNVVIKAGHSVGWRAVGDELHTIMPSSQAGRDLFLRAERAGQFTQRFPSPGVFPYHCAIHPRMKGTVTVVRAFRRARR